MFEECLYLQTKLNKVSFSTLVCSFVVSQSPLAGSHAWAPLVGHCWAPSPKCFSWSWVKSAVTWWEERGPPGQGVPVIPQRLCRQIPD